MRMFLSSLNVLFRGIYRTSTHLKNVSSNKITFDYMNKVNLIKFRHYSSIIVQDPVEEKLETKIKEIANGDPEIDNRLRVLILEIDVMRQNGIGVPNLNLLRRKHWEELLNKPSYSSRRKYIYFLFKLSHHIENKKTKKVLAREEKSKNLEPEPQTGINYTLIDNSMFIRIYDKSTNKLYNKKLFESMMYGQKMIIDCSYDEYMTKREAENAAKQAMFLFAENRMHAEPYDLHYCNVNLESTFGKNLTNFFPNINEPSFPFNLHKVSYLDLFPKERLVYLTPHCREDLVYDHDAIYIIGCMVDKGISEPISLAKAKELGLKMARLPLDQYLQWAPGSGKSLTLNQVCSIMLDYKLTNDWSFAFKHVPRRKLFDANRHSQEDMNADNTNFTNKNSMIFMQRSQQVKTDKQKLPRKRIFNQNIKTLLLDE